MTRAYDIAKERLNYVYLGNIAADVGNNSYCPNCGALLVERTGYRTKVKDLAKDTCTKCGIKINFIG
jgi:pyruvate formate lyase activating enzyme